MTDAHWDAVAAVAAEIARRLPDDTPRCGNAFFVDVPHMTGKVDVVGTAPEQLFTACLQHRHLTCKCLADYGTDATSTAPRAGVGGSIVYVQITSKDALAAVMLLERIALDPALNLPAFVVARMNAPLSSTAQLQRIRKMSPWVPLPYVWVAVPAIVHAYDAYQTAARKMKPGG
jgi:hypothetical protein